MLNARAYCLYKAITPNDLEQSLQAILNAADNAERVLQQAANQHMVKFRAQMLRTAGIDPVIVEEPYLEFELATFHLQYLQTLQRLVDALAKSLERKHMARPTISYEEFQELVLTQQKSIDANAPLEPQIQERLDKARESYMFRVGQKLDERRQQAIGLHNYVWRTRDDAKVRPTHLANDDKIFSWEKPPATGHPGEEFGCRCIAEPTLKGAGEPRVEVAMLDKLAFAALLAARIKKLMETANKVRKMVPKKPPVSKTPKDILNPGGNPFGRASKNPKIRIGEGGDNAAQDLFKRLSKGGVPETPPGYQGQGMRLPNGDWVGYRPTSKSGTPTIDLDIEGINFRKIHFPE